MKRGSPMRRSPMPAARRRMNRNEPLRGGGPIVRSKPMTVRLRREPLDPQLRAAVFDRCQARCDMCGKPLRPTRWECHHRRLRTQGGLDEMANLLALHAACHTRAHLNRTWAQRAGYIVHRPDDPATRPVWHRDKAWRLPTEREWIGCPAPADAA